MKIKLKKGGAVHAVRAQQTRETGGKVVVVGYVTPAGVFAPAEVTVMDDEAPAKKAAAAAKKTSSKK